MGQVEYIAGNGSRWVVTPSVDHYGRGVPAGREFWAHGCGDSIEDGVIGFYAPSLDAVRQRLQVSALTTYKARLTSIAAAAIDKAQTGDIGMANRDRWEFRINNIRSSGDTFTNWDDAVSAMFRALNRLHHETEGAERDHNGRKESELIAIKDQMKRQRPLGDITLKAMRHGKPWVLQVNRLPWGSAPMIGNRTI